MSAARPHLTGWCSPGNPSDSHARCRGEYVRGPAFPEPVRCECTCHAAPVAETPIDSDETARLGVYDDLAEPDYHADPTSVSASGMKQILRSPAHFLHSLTHPKTSNAMDLGTITHRLVLGRGAEYAVLDPDEIGVLKDGKPAASPTSTAAWKEAVAAAEAKGLIVLRTDQFAAAERMADAVLTHPKASRILTSPGRSEVSMFWRDPAYDVIRRCRWDRLGDDGVGVDVKTCASADPAVLARKVIDFRYELSASWYATVATGLGVELNAYALVWVESSEPHPVVVTELSEEFWERGERLVQKALSTYRACLDSGTWPGYLDDDFATLTIPRWASED